MDAQTEIPAVTLCRVVNGLANLQSDETLSSFVITCGEQRWLVHRVVLSLHSSVLARACKADFQEATERNIDLSADDPACIDATVHYFYNLGYPEPMKDQPVTLCSHIKMCVLADKHDIAPILELATSRFVANATALCESPTSNHAEIVEAALVAYKTPQVARIICDAIAVLVIKFDLLYPKYGSETCSSAFTNAMRQSAELATDGAMRLYNNSPSQEKDDMLREGEKKYYCPSRGCGWSEMVKLRGDRYGCFPLPANILRQRMLQAPGRSKGMKSAEVVYR